MWSGKPGVRILYFIASSRLGNMYLIVITVVPGTVHARGLSSIPWVFNDGESKLNGGLIFFGNNENQWLKC